MTIQTIGKINVLASNRQFVDQIVSYLGVINSTPLGKTLLKKIQTKLGTKKLIIEDRGVQSHMVFQSADWGGVYLLECYVLKSMWNLAATQVRQAAARCINLEQVKNSLKQGMPAITYSSALNKQYANICDKSSHDIRRSGTYGLAINTALPMNLNVEGKAFVELLDPSKDLPTQQRLASLPQRGWYILLRMLLDHLAPGTGLTRDLTIAVAENHNRVSMSDYKVGVSPVSVLVHELIHVHHSLNGVGFKNDAMEEAMTVGLHPFEKKEFTENKFRLLFEGTGFRGHISGGQRDHY